ncbi:MAG: dockerin type I repeat-containing protein, partial [Muribaculaceae bacterium]|nr:dockerin type I repeat-containing protein [Muribaculaceae bacterium]
MGYRLNTPTENEFFLIENRQAGKWDKYLPGHGMLVARVDSTNERIWWSNQVNCNPNRMYFELLRASYSGQDSGSDPFPGSQRVTEINNFTSPALVTWDNKFNDFGIYNITEQNNIISFDVERDTSILSIIEGFEQMPVTTDLNAKNVVGLYSKWDFVKCAVQQADVTQCNGLQAVGMKKPSQITTSAPLNIIPYMMEYTVFNPTSTDAKFRFYYSVDKGESWIPHADGVLDVAAKAHATASVKLPTDQPIMLRFAMTSGSSKVNCYIDDIKLYYKDTWGPIYVTGDVNLDGEVNISDVNTIIDVILGGNDVNGRADVNDAGEINIADINMIISTIVNN